MIIQSDVGKRNTIYHGKTYSLNIIRHMMHPINPFTQLMSFYQPIGIESSPPHNPSYKQFGTQLSYKTHFTQSLIVIAYANTREDGSALTSGTGIFLS